MWTRYYGRFGDLAQAERLERCLRAMMKEGGIQELDLDLDRIRSEFGKGDPTYGRLFGLIHRQHADREGKARWGDQLGMVEAFADCVFETYPDASMIHMVRDPRREGSSRGLRHLGRLGWATGRWLHSADLAMRNRSRYPDRYRVVRYEALVADPEATLREVTSFLGEELEPQMLATLPAVAHTQGDAPTPAATAFVERYASHRLDLLGYSANLQTNSPGPGFYVVDWPANRLSMVAWSSLGGPAVDRRARR
jgi:hypothetical protein